MSASHQQSVGRKYIVRPTARAMWPGQTTPPSRASHKKTKHKYRPGQASPSRAVNIRRHINKQRLPPSVRSEKRTCRVHKRNLYLGKNNHKCPGTNIYDARSEPQDKLGKRQKYNKEGVYTQGSNNNQHRYKNCIKYMQIPSYFQ